MAIAGGAQYQANAAPMGASGANYTSSTPTSSPRRTSARGGVGDDRGRLLPLQQLLRHLRSAGRDDRRAGGEELLLRARQLAHPQPIGIGKLQPLVRWQQTTDPSWKILDAYVTYVIDEYFLRFAVGYEHTDFGGGTTNGNAILLGAQMQR